MSRSVSSQECELWAVNATSNGLVVVEVETEPCPPHAKAIHRAVRSYWLENHGKSLTHTHTSASMCYNTFLFPQTVYLRGSQFFLKRWPALSRWLCPALFTWFHSFSPSVPSGVQLSGCLFSLVSPISQPGWSCPGSPDVSLSFLSLHMSPPSCLSSLVSRHFIPSLTGD